MLPSCGSRGECKLISGFMLKNINKVVDKSHHYFFVILAESIIMLEVGEAGEMEGEPVPLGCVLLQKQASDKLEGTLWWGGCWHLPGSTYSVCSFLYNSSRNLLAFMATLGNITSFHPHNSLPLGNGKAIGPHIPWLLSSNPSRSKHNISIGIAGQRSCLRIVPVYLNVLSLSLIFHKFFGDYNIDENRNWKFWMYII